MPRPAPRDEEREREREAAAEVQAVFDALVAGLPEGADDLDLAEDLNDDLAEDLKADQRARRLLAHLLEFHRREDKSTWWEFFDRCKLDPEELVEHRATLGGLTYDGAVDQVKRSTVHRYRFPEQTHEMEVGDEPKNPDTAESEDLKRGFCGTVVALDEAARTIDLKRSRSSPVPHPAALVPLDTVNTKVLRESLLRLAQAVVSAGFSPDSPRRAAFDLLRRLPPRRGPALPDTETAPGEDRARRDGARRRRVRRDRGRRDSARRIQRPARRAPAKPRPASGGRDRRPGETAPGETAPAAAGAGIVAAGETPLTAVQRIAPRLDRSVLPVQGPPGSGKTYTGARMILDLLAGGKRVGVTANSHKVISNLLAAVCRAEDDERGESGPDGRAGNGSAACEPGAPRAARAARGSGPEAPPGGQPLPFAGSRRRTPATAAPTSASPRPTRTRRWPRLSPRARRTSPAARRGSGRARRWPTRSTCWSSTRPDR